MTQLAKRERNVRNLDLTVQIGVSTGGPVAIKVASRANSFSSAASLTSNPFEVPVNELVDKATALARDFGGAIDEVQ